MPVWLIIRQNSLFKNKTSVNITLTKQEFHIIIISKTPIDKLIKLNYSIKERESFTWSGWIVINGGSRYRRWFSGSGNGCCRWSSGVGYRTCLRCNIWRHLYKQAEDEEKRKYNTNYSPCMFPFCLTKVIWDGFRWITMTTRKRALIFKSNNLQMLGL